MSCEMCRAGNAKHRVIVIEAARRPREGLCIWRLGARRSMVIQAGKDTI